MENQSKHLRVVVVRDGEERANMTFPIYTLNIIDTLMPEAVVESLSQRNIHLPQMISNIKEGGFRPQTLFEHLEESKSYKVWIE